MISDLEKALGEIHEPEVFKRIKDAPGELTGLPRGAPANHQFQLRRWDAAALAVGISGPEERRWRRFLWLATRFGAETFGAVRDAVEKNHRSPDPPLHSVLRSLDDFVEWCFRDGLINFRPGDREPAGKVRFALSVTAEWMRRIKHLAVDRGVTSSDLVCSLVNRSLETQKGK